VCMPRCRWRHAWLRRRARSAPSPADAHRRRTDWATALTALSAAAVGATCAQDPQFKKTPGVAKFAQASLKKRALPTGTRRVASHRCWQAGVARLPADCDSMGPI
jgi:hypothetical protein